MLVVCFPVYQSSGSQRHCRKHIHGGDVENSVTLSFSISYSLLQEYCRLENGIIPHCPPAPLIMFQLSFPVACTARSDHASYFEVEHITNEYLSEREPSSFGILSFGVPLHRGASNRASKFGSGGVYYSVKSSSCLVSHETGAYIM